MITHLHGRLVEKNPAYAIIECAGVGYYCNISLHTYSKIADEELCRIFTHLVVREDAHTLYGFSGREERQLFLHLISVSGVGPSTALLVLSSLQPGEAIRAIVEGDVNALKSVKGIGAKSAQRIILDLRDKLQKGESLPEFSLEGNNTIREEALSALVALGFDKNASGKMIQKIVGSAGDDLTVEEIIKMALKQL